MAIITDLSDLIATVTGGAGESLWPWKDARIDGAAAGALVTGRMTSLWQYEGGVITGGAAPGAVAVPTRATVGALGQANASGIKQKWFLGGTVMSSNSGTLIIYDRLLHISGLDGTVITPQTVGGTIDRYTDGKGNQAWVEIYTQIGATARTITMSYTDDEGNAGQTSESTDIGGTNLREVQRIIPIPLAAGDAGVRAIASVTLSASTGTAGNFGVVIAHPIAICPIHQNGRAGIMDLISGLPGVVEIQPNACLTFAWLAAGTTAPRIIANLNFAEK